MLDIEIVPCLKDNYAYLLRDARTGAIAIVDPSEDGPVNAALARRALELTHIFNTHHHWDHTGGNLALKARWGAKIIGPARDRARIPGIDEGLSESDVYEFGSHRIRVLEIPGHTLGHIALWFEGERAVFTGDTLFSLGCGRLFEGTPAQMWTSLSKLARLPDDTRIFCGHEYTQTNARFALTIEPGNEALRARAAEVDGLREADRPTIPSTIAEEKRANPFLRAAEPGIAKTLGLEGADPVSVFAELRRRKDVF